MRVFNRCHRMFCLTGIAGMLFFCIFPAQYLFATDQDSSVSMTLGQENDNRNTSVTVSKEEIKKIVSDFITQKIAGKEDTITIKNIWVSNEVKLPAGTISYQCLAPDENNSARKVTIPVVFMVNGLYQKKVWTNVEMAAITTAVVTSRALPRNHIITEDDVQVQKMEVKGLPSQMIIRCEEVIGKKTRNAVNAQVVLHNDLLEFPPLVKQGDAVLILAESDALKISALGEVRETGAQGQKIRVLNCGSKKEIYARVVDSNTVKVEF